MFGLCSCGNREGMSTVVPGMPLPFTDPVHNLKNELDEKLKELEQLRGDCTQLEHSKDQLLTSIQQLGEIAEAQEAEMKRMQSNLPGGESMRYWETKHNDEVNERKVLEERKKEEEDKIVLLREEVDELTEKVTTQSAEIAAIKLELGGDPNEDEDSHEKSGFKRSDGVEGFISRLNLMKEGAMVNALVKEKYIPVFVRLSDNANQVFISTSKTKKAFETVNIEEIQAITYPAKGIQAAAKKANKKGAPTTPPRDYFKFNISTVSGTTHSLLAPGLAHLVTWVLGLQNLSAKPGQALLTKGELLWIHTESKLAVEANQRNITKQKMVAEALISMLPEDEVEEIQSARESLSLNSQGVGGPILEGDES